MRATTAKISHGIGFRQLMATVCLRFGKLFRVGFGSFAEPRREANAAIARIHDKAKHQALRPASSHRFAGRAQDISNAALAPKNL
jgi:hypothetical protein